MSCRGFCKWAILLVVSICLTPFVLIFIYRVRYLLGIGHEVSPFPQTEFVDFFGCSHVQRLTIHQDQIDARILAASTLVPANLSLFEELGQSVYIKAGGALTIDWNTTVAIWNWGSFRSDPDREADRARISEKFWKASGEFDRTDAGRVSISCDSKCDVTAFMYQRNNLSLPGIHLCQGYFNLLSLGKVHYILGKYPQLRSNVGIPFHSRASVMLHESLHIHHGPAKLRHDPLNQKKGCVDYVYGSSKAKRLALDDPMKASVNDDNYVSFAAATYISQRYNALFPKYPTTWDTNKTEHQNWQNIMSEPGYVSRGLYFRADLFKREYA